MDQQEQIAALPIIDAEECCNGDIYGYASTEAGALEIASQYFVDPISRIEKSEWRPGEPAWLVLTIYGADDHAAIAADQAA